MFASIENVQSLILEQLHENSLSIYEMRQMIYSNFYFECLTIRRLDFILTKMMFERKIKFTGVYIIA